ncbi:transposase [uncultured Thiocystis sp.]|jgi:IS605 OrfB family transposase|uniref:transposase n=1 Tax=uncultured Thiocystis sp. TaxID=1202134 RepID=UPI0025D09968|nr:transposase [uncultured Thiocystis sp.]
MKVTCIAHARRLNPGKDRALAEQARRLGAVRSEVWQRDGSVSGASLGDRQIRDAWLAEGRTFPVSWRRAAASAERQRLFTALKRNAWPSDPCLSRIMRQHRRRGHNQTHHQIVVRSDIRQFNLGRQKLDRRARKTKSRLRDVVDQATHAVIDKAATIAAEDLTAPLSGRRFAKDTNRRLAAWTKGVIAEALDTVSQRRGSTRVLVNPAYTSQTHSRHGCLLGKRQGDSFHCLDGVVLQADELLNPDSSCSPATARSTESEWLENSKAQLCACF